MANTEKVGAPPRTLDERIIDLIKLELDDESGEYDMRHIAGWLSNGFWIARTDIPPPFGSRPLPESAAKTMQEWLAAKRTKLAEATRLRIGPTYGMVDVGCSGCECGECAGFFKEEERVKDVGQAVFEAKGGARVVLDPIYAELLDGLDVYRLGPMAEISSPVGGFDGDTLMVCIMPRKADVRAVAP